MCVGRGGGSVSCVRVFCAKGYFFEEILSVELYLFKTFWLWNMFLSWWYLKANIIKKKSGDCGTFMLHLSFFCPGGRTEHFIPVTWLLVLFLSWSWMIEWVSPPHCCPSSFSTKTLHTVIVAKIFHVRDVLECKTWIPPPLTLVNFIPENGFMNWTISCFRFLRHGSPSKIVLCPLYPQSPAFLVLPTMHTCLMCPLCVLGEESRHLLSMYFTHVHATCWLFSFCMCVWTGFQTLH